MNRSSLHVPEGIQSDPASVSQDAQLKEWTAAGVKRFLFVFGSLDLGGAERQGLLLARKLKHAGFSPEVWGLGVAGRVSSECDALGISCRPISFDLQAGVVAKMTQVLSFARDVKKAGIDILLPFTWLPNILCGLSWRLTGARLCVWNQRDGGLELRTDSLLHQLAVRLTPCFFSNSRHGADFLKDAFCVPGGKVSVIRNGVELTPPQRDRFFWRTRIGAGTGDFVACMVANFHQNKDHLTLIKSWRVVVDCLEQCGRRAVLALAGRNDGTEDDVRRLVEELHLQRNVVFLGPVLDVTGFLSGCDTAVHVSPSEGAPNAVLEAMAAGLPVVASDNPGIREIYDNQAEIYTVPPNDQEGLAERILRYANDFELRRSTGRSHRRIVDQFYNGEDNFHLYLQQMLRALQNSRQNILRSKPTL